jgi:hypothetical protein
VAVELANAVEGSRTIGNSSYPPPETAQGFILQVDTHLDIRVAGHQHPTAREDRG